VQQTPFFIARRYFFSRQKSSFINIISGISVAGVALGTMALVIVLSVFNGLEQLTVRLHSAYHSELKITAKKGKAFPVSDSLLKVLKKIPNVKAVTEVVEDNALLRYGDNQMAVNLKGVSSNFSAQYDLSPYLITGDLKLKEERVGYAMLSFRIQALMGISVIDQTNMLMFWYPKKSEKIQLDPTKAFVRRAILPRSIVSIDQEFDKNNVLVPLEFAEDLMQYPNQRTSLEIKTKNPELLSETQEKIRQKLSQNFEIKTIKEQQAELLRAAEIEKLFVFVAFAFILVIVSFNIFFSLAMLVIEKKKDLAVLQAQGANRKFIAQIFLYEGSLIAFSGTLIGLIFGFLFCWLQQEFGLIGLGIQNPLVPAYPVKMLVSDFIAVGFLMLILTFLASFLPARNATKVQIGEQL